MSEFAKCQDKSCPCRRCCLRFTAPANPPEQHQEYAIFDRKGMDRCESFMPDESRPTRDTRVEALVRRFAGPAPQADVATMKRDGWEQLNNTGDAVVYGLWDGPHDGFLEISRSLLKRGLLSQLPWPLKEVRNFSRLGGSTCRFRRCDVGERNG